MRKKSDLRTVKLSDLTVDLRVQRRLDPFRVRKIASEFNWEGFGIPCASERPDGTIVIIDGQHRIEAAKVTSNGNAARIVEVFTGLSISDEAAIFRIRNDTNRVSFLDRFRVRVIEEEEVAVSVLKLLEDYGWSLAGDSIKGYPWSAVQSIEYLYKMSPEIAQLTVDVITRAWNHHPMSADHRIVRGVGAFIRKYGKSVDMSILADKLFRHEDGPAGIIARGQGISNIYKGRVSTGVAEFITTLYNKHMKTNKIPPWRASDM